MLTFSQQELNSVKPSIENKLKTKAGESLAAANMATADDENFQT